MRVLFCLDLKQNQNPCAISPHTGSGLSTVSALAKETPREIDCRGADLVIDP